MGHGSSCSSSGARSYMAKIPREVMQHAGKGTKIAVRLEKISKYTSKIKKGFRSLKSGVESLGRSIKNSKAGRWFSKQTKKLSKELSGIKKKVSSAVGGGGNSPKKPKKIVKSSSKSRKIFKNQSLLEEHYGKHGQEIADVLGKSNYSIDKYLDDANYIINNGTYTPELNGYVKFMSGKKYGFVGLDRATGDITTFHIKNVSELIRKAPSLGFGR